MDDYELDLSEYVCILWRGKWILVGVVAVAVALAVVLTLRAPTQYRAEALLAVGGSAEMPTAYTPPTVQWVIERVQDPQLLSRAVRGAAVSAEWLPAALTAKAQGAFIQLAAQSTVAPAELTEVFNRVLTALHEDLRAGVAEAATSRLAELSSERAALQARRAAWDEELHRVREATVATRDRLRAEISRVQNDPAQLGLSVGANATVRGYLVQKELDVLYSRLQVAEVALDGMDRLGSAYVAGIAAWAGLVTGLVALDEEEAALREVLVAPPSPITTVRGLALSGPLKPSLQMNLAVAGVLGLFLGVLLVFFVQGMRRDPAPGADRLTSSPNTESSPPARSSG